MGLFDGLSRRGAGRQIEPDSRGVVPSHVPAVTLDNRGMMSLFKKQMGSSAPMMAGGGFAGGSGFAGGTRVGPARLSRLFTAYGGTPDSVAWVFSCTSLIASTAAAYPWRFAGDDGLTVENAPQPLTSLLEHPNPVWTYFDMIESVLTDLELVGNSYMLRDGLNRLNQPQQLLRLRPERVQIALWPDGSKRGYVYSLPSGIQVPYDANDVMHFRYPNPMDPHYGMGTVEAIAGLLDQSAAMDQHITGFFQNGARISGILTIPGNLSDTQFERIKATYQEQFAGSASAYKMIIAEQATDYKAVTQPPAASGTVELMHVAKDEILSAFGVPEFLLGGAHQAGVEKMEEAQNIFLRAMIPKARRVSERITLDVAAAWGLTFRMDPHANEPLSVRIGYAKEMIGAGARVQEAREAQGLPPLEPGDVDYEMAGRVLVPNGLIPLSIVGEPPRPARSMPMEAVGEAGALPPAGAQAALPAAHDLPARMAELPAAIRNGGKGLDERLDGIEDLLRGMLGGKYSDSQPRDDHGRFAGGGGGSDSAPAGGSDLGSVVDAARQGGGTISPQDGSQPTTGFAVALQGHSSITPADEFFANDANGVPNGVAITSQWLGDNAQVFDDPSMHIGVWHDTANGEVVLDPSEVIGSRDAAIQSGADRNQQAIYDIGGGQEISTGGTGDRPNGKAAYRRREAEEEDQRDDAGGAGSLRRADRRGGRSEGQAGGLTALGATAALADLLPRGRAKQHVLWKPPVLPKGFEQISKAVTPAHQAVRDVQADCLRHGVDTFEPVFREFFLGQRARVIDALAEYGDVNRRAARLVDRPSKAKADLDPVRLFDTAAEAKALQLAYAPALDAVTQHALDTIPSALDLAATGDAERQAVQALRDKLASRVVAINDTTRLAISETVTEGLRRGYSIPQLANGYADESYPGVMGVFDQATGARSELIARTESAMAFNGAQAEVYAANDIGNVEILDGDGDSECADVDGTIQTLEWYQENPIAHPNCVRSAAPSSEPVDGGGGE